MSTAARLLRGRWKGSGGLALGMVVAAPGVLALLALHQRPVLLLSSGIVLFPLSFISFVLVPLLLTAGLLIAAYGARSASNQLSPVRTALITMSVAALLVAAVISLFVHEDPRSYSTPAGGGSTSDVITPLETLISAAWVSTATSSGRLVSVSEAIRLSRTSAIADVGTQRYAPRWRRIRERTNVHKPGPTCSPQTSVCSMQRLHEFAKR